MGKPIIAALWLVVAVTFALQVSAAQVGKGLGADNLTFTEAFTSDDFYACFPNINSPIAHANYFWDYESFVTAASWFAKDGFGLVGGSTVQIQEITAFLSHVAHDTTCGWSGSVGGPYAWGLCYNQELSPSSYYCVPDEYFPCVNGVEYYGRGAMMIYYNYNYGSVGNAMNVNLLNNPDMITNNASLAFAASIWLWMTPQKPNPSAHSVMVGEWKPTKAETDAFLTPGYGLTINLLNGGIECGHGDDPRADDRISHYIKFCSQIKMTATGSNLDCGTQFVLPTGFTAITKPNTNFGK